MKVLIINPGATSTKIAVFDEEEQLFKKSIDHSAQELDRFDRVIDQADFRQKAILDAVTEGGFRLTDFAAVCGRGGLYRPIPSGTYAVNDRVMHDVETAPYGEHPSNLGAYLARRIGDMVGIPAFFVDPVCVDEMTDVAHWNTMVTVPFSRSKSQIVSGIRSPFSSIFTMTNSPGWQDLATLGASTSIRKIFSASFSAFKILYISFLLFCNLQIMHAIKKLF